MITYVLYEIASGRIVHVGASSTLSDAIGEGRRDGHDVVIGIGGGVSCRAHYVVDDAIVPRPLNPGFDATRIAANGIEAARLDLGRPFVATIDDTPHEVPDGVLELTSPMPATYKVQVSAFPYQDYETEIVACA